MFCTTHHYPFRNILIEFCIKDGFLKPCQRPISVHQTTPWEHITVALKIIAGWARLQRRDRLVEVFGPLVWAWAAAGAGFHWRERGILKITWKLFLLTDKMLVYVLYSDCIFGSMTSFVSFYSLFSMQHTWHSSAASSLTFLLEQVHASRWYFSQMEPEHTCSKQARIKKK